MEAFAERVVDQAVTEDPTLDRRHLLHDAGNCLALAASGLLLPAWLQHAAEARETVAGRELGGRRSKNRRGRDRAKRRKRAQARERRRDTAKAPGWSLIKYV